MINEKVHLNINYSKTITEEKFNTSSTKYMTQTVFYLFDN